MAEKLGESAWANRARGELGLVAFLLGDINNAVIRLGQAMKVAESNGDVASLVRWLTLFGHGYVQLDRSEQALDFYDRALKVASTVRELQFPVMTYLGKGNALARLGRFEDAKRVLADALAVAQTRGSTGLPGGTDAAARPDRLSGEEHAAARWNCSRTRQILPAKRAGTESSRRSPLRRVASNARAAGFPRQKARCGRESTWRATWASTCCFRACSPIWPIFESRSSRYAEARDLLDEAADLLEGLLTNASSPWVRSRVIGSMDGVFLARVRLEGSQGQSPVGCSQSSNRRGAARYWSCFSAPIETRRSRRNFGQASDGSPPSN